MVITATRNQVFGSFKFENKAGPENEAENKPQKREI